jgi:hypothetical protein
MPRARWSVLVAVLGLALPTAEALGQRVTLEVRPRPGDTLHVALEQTMALTAGPAGVPDSSTSVTTTIRVHTRDIVEQADARGTIVLATVDSIRSRTTGSMGASPYPGLDRSLDGTRIRLRLARTGASELVGGKEQLATELHALLSAMPAVLPAAPVTVGDTWTQRLPLPSDGAVGAGDGVLEVTFTFDSLSRAGDRAWISLRGRLAPSRGREAPRMTGTVTGTLLLDRARGWVTESRARVALESRVPTRDGEPILVRVTMTQQMTTRAAVY